MIDENCLYCSGTGFTQAFFRLNAEKLVDFPKYAVKLPPVSIGLKLGIFEPATQEDFIQHNGRVNSYAVKCQCSY